MVYRGADLNASAMINVLSMLPQHGRQNTLDWRFEMYPTVTFDHDVNGETWQFSFTTDGGLFHIDAVENGKYKREVYNLIEGFHGDPPNTSIRDAVFAKRDELLGKGE